MQPWSSVVWLPGGSSGLSLSGGSLSASLGSLSLPGLPTASHGVYLSLMHAVIRSTPYLQHRHRLPDLQATLRRILTEEEASPQCQMDRMIVQEMCKEFPVLGEAPS